MFLISFHKLIDGEGKREFQRWNTWQASLTHSFLNHHLGYNLVFFRQEYESEFFALLGNVYVPGITVDVGKWDRRAQAGNMIENPNYGKLLIRDENPLGNESTSNRTARRLQFYANYDFSAVIERWWCRLLGKT